MVSWFLCWKYLRASRLTVFCLISTMLGVSTLVVVNAVIDGFRLELRDRLHRLNADIEIHAVKTEGVPDPQGLLEKIRRDPDLGPHIVGMTATLETMGMIHFHFHSQPVVQPVRLVGIDLAQSMAAGGYVDYLLNQAKRSSPSFDLDAEGQQRFAANQVRISGHGKKAVFHNETNANDIPPPAILGFAIGHVRVRTPSDECFFQDLRLLSPGDSIELTTGQGKRFRPVSQTFVVSDFFKSELTEFDGGVVLVPLGELQRIQDLPNRVNFLHLKLRNYAESKNRISTRLRDLCPEPSFEVKTWEDRQAPLLTAVEIEQRLLNVVLFLILAVAGFMIVAIFSMIVAEKSRDIGILKSLGLPSAAILKIFLGYGFLLGFSGALLGLALGVFLTVNLDEVEHLLARCTGQDVFPRDVFFFDRIPSSLQPTPMILVVLGAVVVAVISSVFPAVRAARLPAVVALRSD